MLRHIVYAYGVITGHDVTKVRGSCESLILTVTALSLARKRAHDTVQLAIPEP